MKAIAVALPLLVATLIGGPASARPFDLSTMNGQLVISVGKDDHASPRNWDRRQPQKTYGHRHDNQNRYAPLSPRDIARILERRGFYDLNHMRTDGRIYTLKARGLRGDLVRLTVSARNGDILDRQILRRPQSVDRRAYARGDYRGYDRRFERDYDRRAGRRADDRYQYPDSRPPFWIR